MREQKMIEQIMNCHKQFKSLSKEEKATLDFSEEKVAALGKMIGIAGQALEAIIGMKNMNFEMLQVFQTLSVQPSADKAQ